MDLVVLVDDVAHCVSGLNESTTCSQIIYALAHATSRKGRFLFVARDKSNSSEYRFTPEERILEFINEANKRKAEVEFVLIQVSSISEEGGERMSQKSDVSLDIASRNEENVALKLLSNNSSCSTISELGKVLDGENNALRQPPPDYNKVLEERIAQVDHSSRTPLTFLNIPNFCLQYLYQLSFSREELETLIDIQDRILSSQKCELVHMEIASLNPIERELLQIIKQHGVLNSLKTTNWQERNEFEKQESERLHTAIAAMRTAIENKRGELYEALDAQKNLEIQLEVAAAEQVHT